MRFALENLLALSHEADSNDACDRGIDHAFKLWFGRKRLVCRVWYTPPLVFRSKKLLLG